MTYTQRLQSLLWSMILTMTIPCVAFGAPPAPVPPVPSPQQRAWQAMEMTGFIHFTVNTFTDREWGDGTEDPATFNPSALDTRQWARVARDAGIKMLILTAKHHDGFCLWPSKYTEHSVKSSPWKEGKGDVVRELSDACREYGLKFGIYLSPWDRHERCYGNSPVYNEYFRNQLRELLTNYGPIAEVWFDGACGEGPNGKRQVYDWPSYYKVVRECQPNALIFGCGPDIRWCGNERGYASETEWSVQPITDDMKELRWVELHRTYVDGSGQKLADQMIRDGKTENCIWYPAECDVSIRPGWFYHPKEDDRVHSLDHLLDIYYKSVGRNGVLLLNLPPDRRGLIHENDVKRLQEFRAVLDKTFQNNVAEGKSAKASNVRENSDIYSPDNVLDGDSSTYWVTDDDVNTGWIEIDLEKERSFDVAMIQESIGLGQRVMDFVVEAKTPDGWQTLAEGTTIGHKRLLRFPPVTASKVRLKITGSRACPVIHTVGLFKRPEM